MAKRERRTAFRAVLGGNQAAVPRESVGRGRSAASRGGGRADRSRRHPPVRVPDSVAQLDESASIPALTHDDLWLPNILVREGRITCVLEHAAYADRFRVFGKLDEHIFAGSWKTEPSSFSPTPPRSRCRTTGARARTEHASPLPAPDPAVRAGIRAAASRCPRTPTTQSAARRPRFGNALSPAAMCTLGPRRPGCPVLTWPAAAPRPTPAPGFSTPDRTSAGQRDASPLSGISSCPTGSGWAARTSWRILLPRTTGC
ncbi:hypothetical protein A4R44_00449 [Amycolatopsis sp. M39]|nr:hypothetical protein A4R44_00449 [Amycolatopsis sp. M39]